MVDEGNLPYMGMQWELLMPWLHWWGQAHGRLAVAGLASWAMLLLLLVGAVGAAELLARRRLCTGHSRSR
jgi:hypothetical protein